MKFFCDVNVWKLAKYLRFAGFDTMTRKDFSLQKIKNVCHREKRIFITRNKNIRSYLFKNDILSTPRIEIIADNNYIKQINYIFSKYPFNVKKVGTRCIDCNVLLKNLIDINHAKICPRCKKKIWNGTHYNMMIAVINKVKLL